MAAWHNLMLNLPPIKTHLQHISFIAALAAFFLPINQVLAVKNGSQTGYPLSISTEAADLDEDADIEQPQEAINQPEEGPFPIYWALWQTIIREISHIIPSAFIYIGELINGLGKPGDWDQI